MAGVAVTLVVTAVLQRRNSRQELRNFAFECQLNLDKIEAWLETCTDLRNKINADNPQLFVGYFDISRLVYVIANQMLNSGRMYRHLTNEGIGALQRLTSTFSFAGENLLANGIRALHDQDKATQLAFVDNWEQQLREARQVYEELVARFS